MKPVKLMPAKLTPVTSIPMTAFVGPQGVNGRDGVDGRDGRDGQQGRDGMMGPMPNHRWVGTALSFQNPDGTFDDPVDLRGMDGTDGGSGSTTFTGQAKTVNYRQITVASFRIKANDLISGLNIFGVLFNGEVTVYLPTNTPPDILINVKDEGGFGHTITLEVFAG